MNQFINKLNILHVEVYQNEISRHLPTVLFSVICCYGCFYRDWKLFCELKSEMKKIENSSGMHFFMFEIFWPGPVKTKTRKSCSRFEIKWQSTWFRHGFLNLLIWFSLERLHSFKKNWIKQKTKKNKIKQERSLRWWLVWVNFILSRINRNSS